MELEDIQISDVCTPLKQNNESKLRIFNAFMSAISVTSCREILSDFFLFTGPLNLNILYVFISKR